MTQIDLWWCEMVVVVSDGCSGYGGVRWLQWCMVVEVVVVYDGCGGMRWMQWGVVMEVKFVDDGERW